MSTVTTNIPLLLLLQLLPLSVALLLFVMRKRIPKLATYAAPIAFLTMGGEALLTIVHTQTLTHQLLCYSSQRILI